MGRSWIALTLLAVLALSSPSLESRASDTIEYASDDADDDDQDEIFTDPEDDDSATPLYDGQFSGGGVSCDHTRPGSVITAIAWLILLGGCAVRRGSSAFRNRVR